MTTPDLPVDPGLAAAAAAPAPDLPDDPGLVAAAAAPAPERHGRP